MNIYETAIYKRHRANGANVEDALADSFAEIADTYAKALKECFTDDGAHCLRHSMQSATNLRRRIAAINSIVETALTEAQS